MDDAIIISTLIIIAPSVAVLERLEGYAIVRFVFLAINIQVERKFVDTIIKSSRLFILSLTIGYQFVKRRSHSALFQT